MKRELRLVIDAGTEQCGSCVHKHKGPDHDWGPQGYVCGVFGGHVGGGRDYDGHKYFDMSRRRPECIAAEVPLQPKLGGV